ncbi:hypothetical protein [Arthrobacter sp. lap29]|uniref:hypothetical protein n=1 Tax=Arthrobacter sp. lap29 TaxID=3056122 RepID=UPI0028F71C8B|nr:hypothetical protein [Arthrobacter sp. lap29]
MIEMLHNAGVKSEYAYAGGFASIALSLSSWLVSRAKSDHSKAQSDRWGIFVGHWAPTFFALGVALKLEEKEITTNPTSRECPEGSTVQN